jgi:porphyrinogen peroxidase
VTGTLFFVPTADFLDDPPPLPGEAGNETTRGEEAAPARDGSLGIGGLTATSQ